MELKDYTIEELKAELKRRTEEKRTKKAEEMKTALRCRNCKHCIPHPNFPKMYRCLARTWGKTIKRNYVVSPSNKACELFERNDNYGNN